jgi:hypothetical protein
MQYNSVLLQSQEANKYEKAKTQSKQATKQNQTNKHLTKTPAR